MERKLKNHIYSNKKKYKTESFRSRREKNNQRRKIIFPLILLLVIISFLFYFLFFSSFFKIKIIEVEGLFNHQEEIEAQIYQEMNSKFFLFSPQNIFVFKQKRALRALEDYNFADIDLKKNLWSRKITLIIKEREGAFIYLEEENCLIADINAQVIKNCYLDDPSNLQENSYPIIRKNTLVQYYNPEDSKIKLEKDYLDFAINLHRDLRDSTEFGLREIILDEELNTVKILLNNGLEVYFNMKNDYQEQLSCFLILKREKSSDFKNKSYLDLRYGDKIFYY